MMLMEVVLIFSLTLGQWTSKEIQNVVNMLVKICLPMIDLDDDDGGLGVDLTDQCEGQVRGRAQHLLRHRCWQARVI